MKDPSQELIDALYTKINGNVTYGGSTIPVYTMVIEFGDQTVEQLIHMGEVRYTENGPKDSYISEGTVDIYIDTYFEGKNEGSKEPMNSIANQVGVILEDTLTMASYTHTLGRVEGMEDFDYELDPAGVIFRKLITYSFIIQQT